MHGNYSAQSIILANLDDCDGLARLGTIISEEVAIVMWNTVPPFMAPLVEWDRSPGGSHCRSEPRCIKKAKTLVGSPCEKTVMVSHIARSGCHIYLCQGPILLLPRLHGAFVTRLSPSTGYSLIEYHA